METPSTSLPNCPRCGAELPPSSPDGLCPACLLGAGIGEETVGAGELPSQQPGDCIGPYKLLEQIGEGGFGIVWLAEQSKPISRKVALKVIKAGMDTREVLARFEAERQALALMDHPNIAMVLDAGATSSGRPYFAMELVKGIPITDYCDEAGLGTRERLVLFGDVCAAINHAHQKGIIHRDIKPSNVMVILHGDKPVAKVIDFGIAKATHGKLTDKTLFTRLEQFIGTPAYMSPEQANLSGLDVDTRSDIYALGVLLYELLTGTPPFDVKSLLSAGYDEMRRIIREVEPPKPSSRIETLLGEERTQLARTHRIEPAKVGRLVEADLDWIVMKAIEKDRTRRYETANAFAQDLVHFLADEPVSATPPSAGYQFRKFAKRNKAALRVAAVLAAVLVAATGVSTWQAIRATNAQKQAKMDAERAIHAERKAAATAVAERAAREESEEINRFLTDVFSSPDPSRGGRTIMVVELLERAVGNLETSFADQPERRAKLQYTLAKTYHGLGLNDEAIGLIEKARDFYLDNHGPEHPETLAAMSGLAASYATGGRLDEAIRIQEEVLELRRRILGAEDPDTLSALSNLAGFYHAVGRRDEALKIQEEVLTLRRRILGAEDSDTLTSMGNLAGSYHAVGRRDEAIEIQEELMVLSRKILGPEHPDMLGAAGNLAAYYQVDGRREEALKMQVEVFELSRKVLGPEHPDTLRAMGNLATSYHAAGRQDEALKMQLEVLAISRRVLGPEHPDTIRAMTNLAAAYKESGRNDEALQTCEEGLALHRKVFGAEHPDTLSAKHNLAGSYSAVGRRDEALKIHEEALAQRRKVLGPEHPDTLNSMDSLALSYSNAGRLEEALKMQEEALELSRKILGPEHPDTVRIMGNLANSYHAAGRLNEALKMHEEALVLSRKVNGPEHPDTLDATTGLAASHHAAGRLDEALKLGEEVLRQRRKLSGPEHFETLTAMHNLALSHSAAGHLDEAREMLEEVLELRRKILGPEHPDTLSTMSGLATSYDAVGRTDDAIKIGEEALALHRKVLGPEHPDTLGTITNLANSYDIDGRREEALKMREEVLSLRREVNGLEHPGTLTAMGNLSVSYHAAGRLDEAIKMGEEVLPLLRKTLGPEHTDTLRVMKCLTSFYHDAARLDEALKMLEEVLPLLRTVGGPKHSDTFLVMKNLAILYLQAGRVKESTDKFSECAELLHRTGGGADAELQARLRQQLALLAEEQCKGLVEEDAIDRYYAGNKESFRETSVHLYTITLELEPAKDARAGQLKHAEALRDRIVGGTPFAEAAREVSEDGWAEKGGDRGKVERGDYREPLNSAIFALQPGTLGIHDDGTSLRILKVEDRVEGGIPPLPEVREQIVEILQRQRRDALLGQWQEAAKVKVDAWEQEHKGTDDADGADKNASPKTQDETE